MVIPKIFQRKSEAMRMMKTKEYVAFKKLEPLSNESIVKAVPM